MEEKETLITNFCLFRTDCKKMTTKNKNVTKKFILFLLLKKKILLSL